MKIWIPHRVAGWLIKRFQRKPYFHLAGYMERWWIRCPPGHAEHRSGYAQGKSGIGIRLHHILRSDNDRHLHCHPWWSVSIVLRGGYWETMPRNQNQMAHLDAKPGHTITKWRGPGSIVFRRAKDRHRLTLPKGSSCWSIFIMGPWEKDWGFHTPSGFVFWRTYLNEPDNQKTTDSN